jgi:hypothetical protein
MRTQRQPLRRGNWSVQEFERLRFLLPRRGVTETARLLRRSAASIERKANELLSSPIRRTVWTAEQDLALRRSWGALEVRLLAQILGRSQLDVRRRAEVLRLRRRSGPWTRAEERLLKELFGTRSDDDLEVCLQRPRAEIAAAAARLCLSKDKRFVKARVRGTAQRMPRWTPAEVRRLQELYSVHLNIEVAQVLRRSVASVANKANQLGLAKSPELLARIGRANVALRYRDVPIRE